jgi:glucose-1-phosphate thymidylyltransferase
MRELTENTPKPLLKVHGRSLLEDLLFELSLTRRFHEVVIVSGYLHEQIIAKIGPHFGTMSVLHAIQEKPTGTYDAVFCGAQKAGIRENEKFLIAHADDLQDHDAFEHAPRYPNAIIAAEAEDPRPYGVLEVSESGVILGFEEKPVAPKSNLVSTGGIVTTGKLFLPRFKPEPHRNGEYMVTDAINLMRNAGHAFHVVKAGRWIPVSTPEDLAKINGLPVG